MKPVTKVILPIFAFHCYVGIIMMISPVFKRNVGLGNTGTKKGVPKLVAAFSPTTSTRRSSKQVSIINKSQHYSVVKSDSYNNNKNNNNCHHPYLNAFIPLLHLRQQPTSSSRLFITAPSSSSRQTKEATTNLVHYDDDDDVTKKNNGQTTTTSTTQTNLITNKMEGKFQPKSIAVIGSGAVGCYYGGRLWEGGHNVQFYMRNEHYETVIRNGLNITSDVGKDIYIAPDQINVSNNVYDMKSEVDWIIVSLKSTGLHSIPKLIQPLLKKDNTTRILVIMNGMIEDDLIYAIKVHIEQQKPELVDMKQPLQCCQTLYGGMALICSNRIRPGHIHHSYFGLLSVGVASTRSTIQNNNNNNNNNNPINEDRIAFEQELFLKHHDVGSDGKHHHHHPVVAVDIAYEDCLIRGRWKKMIWNLPFNGISVAMGGITVDQIVNDPNLRNLAYRIMDETILTANTHLQAIYDDNNNNNNNEPLGENEKNAMMQLSDDMGIYKPSTMLDFINRRSMEVQYLFLKPLEIAKLYNVSTPHLETIVTQIQAYQRMYNLY